MMCLSTFLLHIISQLCLRLKDLVEILRLDLAAVSANGSITCPCPELTGSV